MSISKIATIARHEYVVNVRRLGFIIVTLLFPLLGLVSLLIGAFFSGQAASFIVGQLVNPQKALIGVVDQSGIYTSIPAQFDDQLVSYGDEGAAKKALLSGQIKSYVVIPSDYVRSGKVNSYVLGSGFMSNTAAIDSNALRAFLVNGLLSGKVDSALVNRASSPANINPVTLDEKGNPSAGGALSIISGFIAPYIFSILLFVSVFSSSGYLLRGISEEKENRVIEIILSSVSAPELLAGKVIGLGALGLTQIGVWLLSAVLLSSGLGALVAGAVLILNPGSFFLAAVYFLLGYVLYGTLMAAAGALGTSLRESQQLAGYFTFAAAIPWFLASLVFTNPNHVLLRILSWFPLTAPTMMMLRLPLTDVPLVDIVGSIILLLISIPAFLWLGAKVFRMGLLMYGKRPAVREIMRAMRQA